jgi:hypothetical protein
MGAPRQPEPAHGTRARYNAFRSDVRCRCAACRKANADYHRAYRGGDTKAPRPPASHSRITEVLQQTLPDELIAPFRR